MNQQTHKQKLLDQLYAPYIKCTQCPLGLLGRKNVVFGSGNADARLMFIGEAPGRDEDIQGKPFVGRSGQLLTRILHELSISRDQVFISNAVKCRPPENRKPKPLEIKTCTNLLLFKQIEIIQPKVICTLGSAAYESLFEQVPAITKIHGKAVIFRDTPVIPTFHPAYILRNFKEMGKMTKDIQTAIDVSEGK